MIERRFIKARIYAAVAWSVLIFILMIMRPPAEMSAVRIPGLDKIAHILVFGLMAFLFLNAYSAKPLKRDYLFVIALTCAYSILLETLQVLPFTKRDFDIFDIIANIIGANIAAALFYTFKSRKK